MSAEEFPTKDRERPSDPEPLPTGSGSMLEDLQWYGELPSEWLDVARGTMSPDEAVAARKAAGDSPETIEADRAYYQPLSESQRQKILSLVVDSPPRPKPWPQRLRERCVSLLRSLRPQDLAVATASVVSLLALGKAMTSAESLEGVGIQVAIEGIPARHMDSSGGSDPVGPDDVITIEINPTEAIHDDVSVHVRVSEPGRHISDAQPIVWRDVGDYVQRREPGFIEVRGRVAELLTDRPGRWSVQLMVGRSGACQPSGEEHANCRVSKVEIVTVAEAP